MNMPGARLLLVLKITLVQNSENKQKVMKGLLFDLAPSPFTDLCLKDPGHEVELTVSSDLRRLTVVWMGEISITKGMWDKRVTVTGSSYLKKNIAVWPGGNYYNDVKPGIVDGQANEDTGD
jgi:hypothetical protein